MPRLTRLRPSIKLTSIAAALLFACPAYSATFYWNGSGTGDANGKFWNDPDNWTIVGTTTDTLPTFDHIVRFNNGAADANKTINVNVDAQIDWLIVESAGAGFVFNTAGDHSIAIDGGNDLYTSGAVQPAEFNVDLLVATGNSALSIAGNNAATQLTFNGDIGLMPGNLSTTTTTVLNDLTLRFNGANNLPSEVLLGSGVYVLGHDQALGTGQVRTSSVSSTPTLLLATDSTIGSSGTGNFNVSGSITVGVDPGNLGPKILNIDNRLASDGTITVNNDVTVRVSQATSHLTNFVINSGAALEYDGAGTQYIGTTTANGATSGDGQLVVSNAGSTFLNATLTHTGGTRVDGGLFRMTGGAMPDTGLLTIASGASFQANGSTETIGGLGGNGTFSFGNGFGSAGAASITVTEGVHPGESVGSITLVEAGTLTLGGTSVFELGSIGNHDMLLTANAGQNIVLGGILNIVTLDGVETGDYLLISMNGGELTGAFDQLVLPDGVVAELDTSSGSLVLSISEIVVPEPASFAIATIAAVLMLGRRPRHNNL